MAYCELMGITTSSIVYESSCQLPPTTSQPTRWAVGGGRLAAVPAPGHSHEAGPGALHWQLSALSAGRWAPGPGSMHAAFLLSTTKIIDLPSLHSFAPAGLPILLILARRASGCMLQNLQCMAAAL